MSTVSFLEKLLDGAPVEWKPLGDITTLKRGRVMSKRYLVDNAGDFPVYSSQTAKNGVIGKIDTFDFDGKYISWTTDGANAGTVFHRTGKFSITNVCGLIKINEESKLSYKFLFYWLSIEAQKHVYSGMGNPKLMSHQVEKIQIPIPCPGNLEKSLAIQAEIVRILDAFTSLTTELTTRKKQYAYYCDQLLAFEEGEVEWKPLGEVANFTNGKGHEKDIDEDGKYIVVNSKFISTDGQVAKFSNNQICPLYTDDILLVMSDLPNGKALSKTFTVDVDDKYTLNQRIGGITVKNKEEILPKFLHYFLNRTPQLLRYNNGVDQTNLRKGQILGVKVPIVSLTEQARIVSLLDKFDTLTHSITEGLPREIELRQKQYAYYRDLLLNFPKPDKTAA